jgi:hypothetical protein
LDPRGNCWLKLKQNRFAKPLRVVTPFEGSNPSLSATVLSQDIVPHLSREIVLDFGSAAGCAKALAIAGRIEDESALLGGDPDVFVGDEKDDALPDVEPCQGQRAEGG